MNIILTNRAKRHLNQIFAYLEAQSPVGKVNVQRRINESIQLIAEQPFSGRKSNLQDVYIKVVNPYLYLIFYRVKSDSVVILTIRHTSRRPLA